jgi:hypothetical protein
LAIEQLFPVRRDRSGLGLSLRDRARGGGLLGLGGQRQKHAPGSHDYRSANRQLHCVHSPAFSKFTFFKAYLSSAEKTSQPFALSAEMFAAF